MLSQHSYLYMFLTLLGTYMPVLLKFVFLFFVFVFIIFFYFPASAKYPNYFDFITEKPNATTNCSQTSLNEGTDITCLCYSTSGSPPPTASWFKDGKMIGDVGYMKKELLLKSVTKEDSGTYVCKVRSYSLTDDKSVQVIVKCTYSIFL